MILRFGSLAIVWMGLICCASSPSTIVPPGPISVCEVLQNLDKYRGTIIEVRGEFSGGDIRAQCPPLVTQGYTWFNGIQIEFPQNFAKEDQELRQWSFDTSVHTAAVERAAALQSASGPKAVIQATIAGRLDARDPLLVVTDPGHDPTPIGYGHLGVYPARLILVRITDVRVANE